MLRDLGLAFVVFLRVRHSNTGSYRLEVGLLTVTKFSEQHFILFTVMLTESSSPGRREWKIEGLAQLPELCAEPGP